MKCYVITVKQQRNNTIMPRKKRAARASAQNLRIAAQKHIDSELIQFHQRKGSNLQPKQFHPLAAEKAPLIPTHLQKVFWNQT
jgi:hypothetical protein